MFFDFSPAPPVKTFTRKNKSEFEVAYTTKGNITKKLKSKSTNLKLFQGQGKTRTQTVQHATNNHLKFPSKIFMTLQQRFTR